MKMVLLMVAGVASLIGAIFGLWVWGAVIAFQSHVLTGVLVLIVEPLPFIVGILDGIFSVGVADAITGFITSI